MSSALILGHRNPDDHSQRGRRKLTSKGL